MDIRWSIKNKQVSLIIIIFINLADEISAQILADFASNCLPHTSSQDTLSSVYDSFHIITILVRHLLRQVWYHLSNMFRHIHQLLLQLSHRLHTLNQYKHLHCSQQQYCQYRSLTISCIWVSEGNWMDWRRLNCLEFMWYTNSFTWDQQWSHINNRNIKSTL